MKILIYSNLIPATAKHGTSDKCINIVLRQKTPGSFLNFSLVSWTPAETLVIYSLIRQSGHQVLKYWVDCIYKTLFIVLEIQHSLMWIMCWVRHTASKTECFLLSFSDILPGGNELDCSPNVILWQTPWPLSWKQPHLRELAASSDTVKPLLSC